MSRRRAAHADKRVEHLRKRFPNLKEATRPRMLGRAPSEKVARKAYILAQAIRSEVTRAGIAIPVFHNFIVHVYASPHIPRPGSRRMASMLKESLRYIRETAATGEAPERILYTDDEGKITLGKSKGLPGRLQLRIRG